jgi:hypothetical protein
MKCLGLEKKATRPGGTAEDVRPGEIFRQFRARPESGVPPGRESLCYYSRHFVPGYYHSVPSGQKLLLETCPQNRLHIT